jgi:hypothetical protein
MNDLHRYLTNPFDDAHLSLDDLISFSTDHLSRFTANNPGAIFDDRIATTTTALNGVAGSYTDDKTALALRKSKKQLKKNFREALPASIAKIHGAVTAQYGENSAEETEIFPKGRTAFTRAHDGTLQEELETLVNGLTAHQADLGAAVVTTATSLVAGWKAVYQSSAESGGNKSKAVGDKLAARSALQLELFKNLLTIALNFPGQPEQLDTFMQQSLLHPHTPTTSTLPPAPEPPAAPAK